MTASITRSSDSVSLIDVSSVLVASFGTHVDDLPELPFTATDPLIVGRRNPIEKY